MTDNELDAAYTQAARFDAQQFYKWLDRNCVVFTKRTDFPKLGYLIHRLNEAGIPSVQHGDSWHAPLLWVRKQDEKAADAILVSNYHGRRLDDVSDDAPSFRAYADTQPDPDLWAEGLTERETAMLAP